MFFPLVVLIGTAAVVSAGIYLTLRGFRASEVRANGGMANGHDAIGTHHHPHVSRHSHATDDILKRFFDGKDCAMCKRAIPAVHRTGLKPGLFNPVTHETRSWDEIPNDNVSAALEAQLPLCSDCRLAESFRQRFPDRVTDRERTPQNEPSHA